MKLYTTVDTRNQPIRCLHFNQSQKKKNKTKLKKTDKSSAEQIHTHTLQYFLPGSFFPSIKN